LGGRKRHVFDQKLFCQIPVYSCGRFAFICSGRWLITIFFNCASHKEEHALMGMRASKQKKWYRGFFISHVLGYTISFIQTMWIVLEVRHRWGHKK
jgi:hypothetical protein